MDVKNWYDRSYEKQGINAQRKYPNEEFSRFLGRNLNGLSKESIERMTALEVGCGSGGNLWVLAELGCRTIGLDLSEKAIHYASSYLDSRGLKARFICESMEEMGSVEDSSIDLVADIFSSNCLNIAEHEQFLRQINRILTPSGKYFIYTPGKNSDAFKNHYPAELVDKNTLNGIYRKTSPYTGNEYKFRFDSSDELKERVEKVGLRIDYIEHVTRTYSNGEELFEFITAEIKK